MVSPRPQQLYYQYYYSMQPLSPPIFQKISSLPEYIPDIEFVKETQPDPEPITKLEQFTETQPNIVWETQAEPSNPKWRGKGKA